MTAQEEADRARDQVKRLNQTRLDIEAGIQKRFESESKRLQDELELLRDELSNTKTYSDDEIKRLQGELRKYFEFMQLFDSFVVDTVGHQSANKRMHPSEKLNLLRDAFKSALEQMKPQEAKQFRSSEYNQLVNEIAAILMIQEPSAAPKAVRDVIEENERVKQDIKAIALQYEGVKAAHESSMAVYTKELDAKNSFVRELLQKIDGNISNRSDTARFDAIEISIREQVKLFEKFALQNDRLQERFGDLQRRLDQLVTPAKDPSFSDRDYATILSDKLRFEHQVGELKQHNKQLHDQVAKIEQDKSQIEAGFKELFIKSQAFVHQQEAKFEHLMIEMRELAKHKILLESRLSGQSQEVEVLRRQGELSRSVHDQVLQLKRQVQQAEQEKSRLSDVVNEYAQRIAEMKSVYEKSLNSRSKDVQLLRQQVHSILNE